MRERVGHPGGVQGEAGAAAKVEGHLVVGQHAQPREQHAPRVRGAAELQQPVRRKSQGSSQIGLDLEDEHSQGGRYQPSPRERVVSSLGPLEALGKFSVVAAATAEGALEATPHRVAAIGDGPTVRWLHG